MMNSSKEFAIVPAHNLMQIEVNDKLGISNAFSGSIASGVGFDVQDPSFVLPQPSIKVGVNQSASLVNATPIFH